MEDETPVEKISSFGEIVDAVDENGVLRVEKRLGIVGIESPSGKAPASCKTAKPIAKTGLYRGQIVETDEPRVVRRDH